MKLIRVIKKSDSNDSIAVVVIERFHGFIPVQELVCLMGVSPESECGDTVDFDEKEMELVPTSDEEPEEGQLRFMRLSCIA